MPQNFPKVWKKTWSRTQRVWDLPFLNSKPGGWLPRPLLDDCFGLSRERCKHAEHTTHLCWLNHLHRSLRDTKITQSCSLDQDSDRPFAKPYQGWKMHARLLSGKFTVLLFSLSSSCGKSPCVMVVVQTTKQNWILNTAFEKILASMNVCL